MKRNYLSLIPGILLAHLALGQGTPRVTADFNDISYRINGNGVISFDEQNNIAAYHVPKTGNANPLFYMNSMVLAQDVNGQAYAALGEYSTSDFSFGPIADDYNAAGYSTRYNHLWKMSWFDVNYHMQHYMDAGYVADPTILDWPAHGNTANGEAAILAPFADLNANGIYEPLQGEYPDIPGDFVIYSIINDQHAPGPYGQQRPGVEIHLMYYVFATNDAIDRTSFVHATVYNRSTRGYSAFQYGAFTDFDLGNYNDDYLGTSIEKNTAFVYNGDNNDDGTFGNYGLNPPAFGVVALNGDLYAHTRSADTITTPSRFSNLMNGLLPDGAAMTDENGEPTRYTYAGANTENSLLIPPGDRRSVISFTPQPLGPLGHVCYDYALVYAREANSGPLYSVDSLLSTVDFVQEFYNGLNMECGNGTLSVNENHQETFQLYPNPAEDKLTIRAKGSYEWEIITISGSVVVKGASAGEMQEIDIAGLQAGTYFVRVKGHDSSGMQKVVVR